MRPAPPESRREDSSGGDRRRGGILFVTTVTPDPNGRGIDRRAAQHLEALTSLGPVDIVLPDAEPRCHTVEAVNPTVPLRAVILRPTLTVGALRLRRIRGMRWRLAQRVSSVALLPSVEQRACAHDARDYREQFNRTQYDLIFAFRLPSATWIDSLGDVLPGIPRVVDFDDIESLAHARRLALTPAATRLWRLRECAFCAQIRRLERRTLAGWTAVLVCSDLDRDRLARNARAIVRVVPNAIAVPPPAPPALNEEFNVLFVGTLDYEPNAIGLSWFLTKVWPQVVHGSVCEPRLHIVGANPSEDLRAFDGRHGINVHGRVDRVEPYYERADVAIAPIPTGGGTRIKILEAFAQNRAVVSTTVGCEGIPAHDGKHLLIADQPTAFASALLTLSREPELRSRLAGAAYVLAREQFERNAVQADLARWLNTLMRQSAFETSQRVAVKLPLDSV